MGISDRWLPYEDLKDCDPRDESVISVAGSYSFCCEILNKFPQCGNTSLLEKYPTLFCENLMDFNEARLHEATFTHT